MIFARPWLLLLVPLIAAWAAFEPTQRPRRALALKTSMRALAARAVAASERATVLEQQEVRS